MKTRPIVPAPITEDAEGQFFAPAFDDRYPDPVGAVRRAQRVFLAGNDLPSRWRGRGDFVVFEVGFGLGHNFLATWDAWRRDAHRCARLHYVAVDPHPPQREHLPRAHRRLGWPVLAAQLQAAWPEAIPGLHLLPLDEGRVRLLLGWGEIDALLPELQLQADAFYLDGFAPDRNPAMWQRPLLNARGRRAAPGATAAAGGAAGVLHEGLQEGLQAAGFEVERISDEGSPREFTQARFAPRWPVAPVGQPPRAPGSAIVVGAGLAGASVAAALAARGWAVTVLERHDQPAAAASGNPGGLFHGTLHPDDGPHARLLRAAALHAARCYRPLIEAGGVRGAARGLLRLAGRDDTLQALQAACDASGLPRGYVRALDAQAATVLAGVPIGSAAWFPGGGWISPGDLVRHWLSRTGVRLRTGVDAAQIEAIGSGSTGESAAATTGWRVRDSTGAVLAEASVLVLAGAGVTPALLATLRSADPLLRTPWALGQNRGQIDGWLGQGTPLALPVAGDGYALPLADGLLYGASITPAGEGQGEVEGPAPPTEAETRFNRERLARLTGLVDPMATSASLQALARSARRVQTPDRLPLAGPMPLPEGPALTRADPLRRVPRWPGLFVSTALGSRGITWAPLLGEWLAACIADHPWPLERDLADALDPARRQRQPRALRSDPPESSAPPAPTGER
jgi:tRNA 5-methylaminomethyl-2-thiouridine biosynthesis bifunctional protein